MSPCQNQKQPECPLGHYDRETGTTHPLGDTYTASSSHNCHNSHHSHHSHNPHNPYRTHEPPPPYIMEGENIELTRGGENVELTGGGVSQGDYDWDCGGYNHSCNHSCGRDCGRIRASRRCCLAFFSFLIIAGVIAIALAYLLTRRRTSPFKYVIISSIILLL
jgi:hypothetical protein